MENLLDPEMEQFRRSRIDYFRGYSERDLNAVIIGATSKIIEYHKMINKYHIERAIAKELLMERRVVS